MSYLFYIDDRNSGVILRPDCYKLCPELSVLDEKEMMMIILIYDYHSIYRQFPEADRRRKAMAHVYGENMIELFEKQKIKNAIEAYRSLQYDPKIELAEKYQAKIDKMLELMEDDDSPTSNKKTLETIDLFRKAIRELENEVAESVANKGQIKGGQELSFLEELMRNKKYYQSVIAKK
jgi:hypothetical protein